MLRNKNVTSTSLMNRTQSIPSLLPFVENRTYNLSPRVEFYAKKAIITEFYAQKTSLEVREFVKFLFETVFFVETIHTSVCLSEFLTTCVEWVRIRSDFHT